MGPTRAIKTIGEAARLARDGAVVEVDAGEYQGDVAVWTQDRLRLRAVGGRVRLVAAGEAAEAKGIWVVRGGSVQVEGFDFTGARVPGRNGAGIRFETGTLKVRDCGFFDNEMGLLTNNDGRAILTVENSEFAHNGRPDGHNHNLYVGRIAELHISGSYLHHGRTGHLLKSRAALSRVLYNRLTDEAGGHASYELELPNGGVAHVLGNILHQCRATENPAVVSFGAEGTPWPRNALYLVHNTIVDDLAGGAAWLQMRGDPAELVVLHNLLAGGSGQVPQGQAVFGNLHVATSDLADPVGGDYRLLRRAGVEAHPGLRKWANVKDMVPDRMYRHPRDTVLLRMPASLPGAVQPA